MYKYWQLSETELSRGGGVKLRVIAKGKMRDYIRRYHRCTPHDLLRIKKFPFVYLLYNTYGFKPKEIADFFECSTTTMYKIISDADFYHKKSKKQVEEENRIAEYILYIMKYK